MTYFCFQVANLAVFTYFIASLFSRQFFIPDGDNKYSPSTWGNETFPDSNIPYSSSTPFNRHTPDFAFPLFNVIEFMCYVGWIKVAESLLNPFENRQSAMTLQTRKSKSQSPWQAQLEASDAIVTIIARNGALGNMKCVRHNQNICVPHPRRHAPTAQ